MPALKKRVFSGIQPSGELHIGNYLGALRNWARLQDDYAGLYCVVDYHAITQPYAPAEMMDRVIDAARGILAAGIDPEQSIVFVQSHVPEHTELAWIFSSMVSIGALERMTQFKEKSAQHRGKSNAGLFTYPVLQAADILLYRGEAVPVGEDQVQHLELSRDIARRFNHTYGELFPEPMPLLTPTPRIMGVDGKTKMSKSRNNAIHMLGSPEERWERLRTAVTDENRKRRNDPGNPEICGIFTIHQAMSAADRVATVDRDCRSAAIGCVDCKKLLAESMEAELAPVNARARELTRERVIQILDQGARRATAIARSVMAEVRSAMGLGFPGGSGRV